MTKSPRAETCGAILLLGGSGMRFGSSLPKQFHSINGKAIFEISAEKLTSIGLGALVIVVNPEYENHEIFKKSVERLQGSLSLPIKVASGGKSRHISFRNGLLSLSENFPEIDRAIIHDANRPSLSEDFLFRIRSALHEVSAGKEASIPVVPVTDSIVVDPKKGRPTLPGDPDSTKIHYHDRAQLFRVQTPQALYIPAILKALKKTTRDDFTDEGSFALEMGLNLSTFNGDEANIKITYQEDLQNALL